MASPFHRHSSESWNLLSSRGGRKVSEIPAFAGMTMVGGPARP